MANNILANAAYLQLLNALNYMGIEIVDKKKYKKELKLYLKEGWSLTEIPGIIYKNPEAFECKIKEEI